MSCRTRDARLYRARVALPAMQGMHTTLERGAAAATPGSSSARRKSYRTPAGPVEAVRGVDLAVARGETVALLGPNGACKSTTIDLLLGMQPPDAGTVALPSARAGSTAHSRPARDPRAASGCGWRCR